MKLPKNLFPPVTLTPEQCDAYERLADGVVNQALREYDDFNVVRSRQLDRKRWKQIKKSDDITVYCERTSYINKKAGISSGSSGAGSQSSGSPNSRSAKYTNGLAASRGGDDAASSVGYSDSEDDFRDTTVINSPVSKLSTAAVSSIAENEVISTSKKERAPLPKILAVGRVPGKVEDMVYGISSPTPTHSQIKTAYVIDEIADCRVLQEIKSPTPDDPLRFLGLKWIIKAHSAVIGTVVRQRDFVFVESIGLKTREDGSRIGYFVMHSVEVPECGELTRFSIVRARLSLVYIMAQSTHGQVDVFMKSYVELNGTLPDAVGVRTAGNSLVSVALTELGGHHRKLGWAVTKKLSDPARQTQTTPLLSAESNCSNCNRAFSRFSTTLACFFCSKRVCSKCCEQRDLTIPNPDAKTSRSAKLTTKMSVNTCTRCYSTVFRNMEAEDVAREEVLAGEYGVVPKDYHSRAKRSPSSGSSTSSLDISSLQNLTILGSASSNGAKVRSATVGNYDHLTQPQTQLRDWSGSVIELDRDDFVRGPEAPYQRGGAAVQSHTMGYSGQPATRYQERPVPAYYGAPQRMGYGAPPRMAYGAQPPMDYSAPGYGAPQSMGYSQPHTMYSNPPPMNYGAPASHQPQPADGDLYARITKLHQTAEQVYQYTKRTTVDNSMGPASAPTYRA